MAKKKQRKLPIPGDWEKPILYDPAWPLSAKLATVASCLLSYRKNAAYHILLHLRRTSGWPADPFMDVIMPSTMLTDDTPDDTEEDESE